jgi:hypothetical protein
VDQQPEAISPEPVAGEPPAEPVVTGPPATEPASTVGPSATPSSPRHRSRWLNLAAIGVLGLTAIGVAFALGRASTTWDVGPTADYAARQPAIGAMPGWGAMPGHHAGPRDGSHSPMSPGGMRR